MVSKPLLAVSNVADFQVYLSFKDMVLCVFPSNILRIASPDISSMNGAFTLINFCSFAFNTVHFLSKEG